METNTEKQTNEILDLMLTYRPLRDEVVIQLPTPEEREADRRTVEVYRKLNPPKPDDPEDADNWIPDKDGVIPVETMVNRLRDAGVKSRSNISNNR